MNRRGARPGLPATEAGLTALVFATDPAGCGGITLRGMPGPGRDSWLAAVRGLLPPATPWRKVPVNVSDDRLLGGLDFSATVRSGRPVFETGLLEATDGGVLILAMAERLPASAGAIIAAAMDGGEVRIERDGATRLRPARFGVVACDEGLDEHEGIPGALAERLALALRVDDIGPAGLELPDWTPEQVAAARERADLVDVDEEVLALICNAAAAFGITSARAGLLTLRVARIVAALAGRAVVTDAEAALAARLVLPVRARSMPAPEAPPPPDRPEEERRDEESKEQDLAGSEAPADVLVDAVQAAIPPGLLELLARGAAPRRRRTAGGRGGAPTRSPRRGRPVGVRAAHTLVGQRLNVLATLKAAAPWQRLRRASATRSGGVLELRREDLAVTRFEAREETTTLFLVDASGSQAARRLAEVKGAIELLLHDCYVRRDQVGMIAFRGAGADTVLPPTRALARARRSLAAMPGGGGTPLAAGLDAARELADAVARSGRTPTVVLLTDGRANIARDGEPGATRAQEDALASARLLRAAGLRTLLVDTSRRPSRRARALAEAMGGRYVPLPHADADAISATVQRSVA